MLNFYIKKHYLVFLITLFSCPAPIFAQTGTSCSTAEVIGALPYSAPNRSTCSGGNNYTNRMACASQYMTGQEYVFTYSPTSVLNNCISVSASGSTNAKSIFIVEGCPDASTSKCVAQANNDASGTATVSNVQLTIGKTYYIIASAQFGCYTFNLNVTTGVCSAPPAGTNCSYPTVIGSVPYSKTLLTTCGYASNYNQGNICASFYMNGEDYVFKYSPAANECVGITLANTLNYSGVFVLNGCPDDPKSICIASASGTSNPGIPYVSLTAGQTYYIVVASGSTTNCTPFDIQINPAACGPVGSTCGNPKIIPSLPYVQTGLTTCGSKKDYNSAMMCSGLYTGGEDYVFSYNSPATECIEIRLSGTSSGTGLYVLEGCPDSYGGAVCAGKAESSSATKPPALVVNVQAGKSYYIVVSKSTFSGCTGFGIDIRTLPLNLPGTSCGNPVAISSLPFTATSLTTACYGNDYTSANACGSAYLNGQDFVYEYDSPGSEAITVKLSNTSANRVGVFVTNKCPNTAGAVCVASRTSTSGNPLLCTASLTTPGKYYIIVDTDPSGTTGVNYTSFDISIERKPPGSTCTDPYVIGSLPFSQTGFSTACFGNDYNSTMACSNTYMNGEDFVFRYTASAPECLNIALTGLGTYVGLFVLNNCPNVAGTACIAQTACGGGASCASGLNLMANLTAAGTYYIIVATNGWTTTPFNISVSSSLSSSPTAKFSSDVPDPCVGDQVTFYDQSVPCATSWTWSFPGGTPSSSTSCCPVVTYPTKGKYDVSLTVCNPMGCNSISKTNYITVK